MCSKVVNIHTQSLPIGRQVGVPGFQCPVELQTLLTTPSSLNPVPHSKKTSASYVVPFVTDTVPLAGAIGSSQSTTIDKYTF